MARVRARIVACAVMLAGPVLRAGGENINYADINKIKAEGLQHSQVMELVQLAVRRLRARA